VCHPFAFYEQKAATMSMERSVVGGVDTHADTHVAAVVDANGGILGIKSFLNRPGFSGDFGVSRGGSSIRAVDPTNSPPSSQLST
jgi:hypothetical protein